MSSMREIVFAENLKLLMKEHGYNQVRLAKLTGISQSAISAWLLGKKEPSILSLWILADVFDTTVDELIGRNLF